MRATRSCRAACGPRCGLLHEPARLGRIGTLAWIVAAAATTAAAALAFVHLRKTRSAQYAVRFQVPPPEKSIISSFALSPDGRYLAFVAAEGGRTQLWVRPVDSLEARSLPSTNDALPAPDHVFWSPDRTVIGFIAQRKLKEGLGQWWSSSTGC
jgi:hypothetical protein